MAWHHGRFVRHELATPDPAASQAFYAGLLGWAWRPGPEGTFVASVTGRDVADLIAVPERGPAAWTPVMSLPDVDVGCEAAVAAGGRVGAPPRDVAGLGRVARLVDPQGAALGVLHGEAGDPDLPIRPPPSTFCWETLYAADVTEALTFCRRVLPVVFSSFDAMRTLAAADGSQIADVQQAPPGVPTHWLSHVAVSDLGAAREQAAALGAQVIVAELEIPNFGRLAWIRDPQGADLSLLDPF